MIVEIIYRSTAVGGAERADRVGGIRKNRTGNGMEFVHITLVFA